MDWLFEIGHNMAIINHCYEKIQYLQKELETADDSRVTEIGDKINSLVEIRKLAYEAYDIEMSYIFDTIPDAERDNRCLLKHASTALVLAQETSDALDNSTGDVNLNKAFQLFAGIVSLAIGIEFNTCMRCIYDGVKSASELNKKGQQDVGLQTTKL